MSYTQFLPRLLSLFMTKNVWLEPMGPLWVGTMLLLHARASLATRSLDAIITLQEYLTSTVSHIVKNLDEMEADFSLTFSFTISQWEAFATGEADVLLWRLL